MCPQIGGGASLITECWVCMCLLFCKHVLKVLHLEKLSTAKISNLKFKIISQVF